MPNDNLSDFNKLREASHARMQEATQGRLTRFSNDHIEPPVGPPANIYHLAQSTEAPSSDHSDSVSIPGASGYEGQHPWLKSERQERVNPFLDAQDTGHHKQGAEQEDYEAHHIEQASLKALPPSLPESDHHVLVVMERNDVKNTASIDSAAHPLKILQRRQGEQQAAEAA